jgi:hypothetical protein
MKNCIEKKDKVFVFCCNESRVRDAVPIFVKAYDEMPRLLEKDSDTIRIEEALSRGKDVKNIQHSLSQSEVSAIVKNSSKPQLD